MKKTLKILTSILIVLWILIGAYFLYDKYRNKELSGEKIFDGMYLYKLDVGDQTHGVRVYDKNIYYWIENNNGFDFYKINIYNNKSTKIGDLHGKDFYCYFEEDYIECSNDDKMILYDFNFKKLYEGDIKTVIPYKKKLMKFENNTIYYDDKKFKIVKEDLTEYNYYRHESFDNNIYLFFSGYRDLGGCLLNVMDNKCEDYSYTNVKKYNNGLYFIDKENIKILDVNTKKIKEYKNPFDDALLALSQLYNNKLYNFVDDYLKIYNLDNNKVSFLDYRLNEYIDDIYLNDGLLYLIESDRVYIVNLNEIILEEMTYKELETKLNNRLIDRINSIKNDYNVEIKIKEEADLKFKVFKEKMIGERSYDLINDSLDYTEEVFKMFGSDFFKEFIHDEYKGLRIYLTSEIQSNDFSKSGEAFRYYDNYAIIANSSEYKRTLCHELLHSLEDAASVKDKLMFTKWNKYNPKDFNYKIIFQDYEEPYKYTINYGKGDVYFIDNYSQTNEHEDRARIFENICMNTTSDIKNNQYLLKKAEYEKNEILKYYPILKDTVIFDSLK